MRRSKANGVKGLDISLVGKAKNVLYGNTNVLRSKYKNTILTVDGVKWHSKFEYSCWEVLKSLEKEGKIKNLKRQVRIKFEYNGVVLWRAIPDYYFEIEIDDKVIPIYADAKNTFTEKARTFKTTQRFCEAFYGRPILVFKKDTNIEKSISSYRF